MKKRPITILSLFSTVALLSSTITLTTFASSTDLLHYEELDFCSDTATEEVINIKGNSENYNSVYLANTSSDIHSFKNFIEYNDSTQTVTITSEKAYSGINVYIAGYSNDQLISIKSRTTDISIGDTSVVFNDFDSTGAEYVKVFVWNSSPSFSPVFNTCTNDLEENNILEVNMPSTWLANAQTAYDKMHLKMKELDYEGIPFFIQTDSHGLSNDPAKWVNNIDKRVKNINLGDIVLYNFNVKNAKAYYDSTKGLSNLITVYGNHDTHYQDGYSEEPASYFVLNKFYPSTNRKSSDEHNYFTVTDDTYNTKYIVLCPYYLTNGGTGKAYKFDSKQIEWLIEELTENDGYDIVILMHEPLKSTTLIKRDGTLYPHAENEKKYSGIWDMLVKRKKKESGSITDSDGIVHQYDFTDCTSDYLCSFHGHTHNEAYYVGDITEYTGEYHRNNCACTLGIIDRLNRKLFIYKFDTNTVYDTWELDI